MLENLNQSHPAIINNHYEALKIQEVSVMASGGPRLSKVQILSLDCSNLQFLELFSCKQLFSFKDLKIPRLRSLRLLMLSRLTNQAFSQLLSSSEELEQIFLMDLQSVTIIQIPSSCKKLRMVDLYDCKAVESIAIMTTSLQSLTLSDGRHISRVFLANEHGLYNLHTLRLLGCPKMPLEFMSRLLIRQLKKLELVSNAPSAKAYMKVESNGFHDFVKNNCHSLEEVSFDKVHNISLKSVLLLIQQCHKTLQKAVFDLTEVEKPKVREALGHCENLKENKVEKWYIKKKWTEW